MSRKNPDLDRRRFTRSLGLSAAGLPFFKMLEASAAPAPRPMRLLALCSCFGGRWDFLRPPGVSITSRETPLTDSMLAFSGSILEPLKAFIPQMLVIEGLSRKAALMPVDAKNPAGPVSLYSGHDNWAPTMLTGSAVSPAPGTMFDMRPKSASLEFMLGQQLGNGTAVRSLQVGIGSAGRGQNQQFSFDSNGTGQPALDDPQAFYRQMFGSASGTNPVPPAANVAEIKRKQSQSVVDAVNSSAKRLRARLATTERSKLDDHLAALADIEARLSATSNTPALYQPVACDSPVKPPATASASSSLPDATAAQFDIITQAFACDRTRFIVADWGINLGAVPSIVPSVTDLHGQVAHAVEGDNPQVVAAANRNMAALQTWHAAQLAKLMTRLSQTPDGDGTLLDNTLVLWTTDFGENVHGGLNVPHILLGGAQKKFRMGRYLNVAPGKHAYGNVNAYVPANHLFVSLLQAFGLNVNQFGSEKFMGPLAGLT